MIFPQKTVDYAFIAQQMQKTHFLNGFSTKVFTLPNGPRIS
jgi:hypothetical protein